MKEKKEVQNRFEETRYFETRNCEEIEDEFRRNIDMMSKDPFFIDPLMIPEGMVYGWKREYIHKFGGDEDKGRVPECMRKGWSFVPQERHPHHDVRKGGQILMERSKRLNDHEFDRLNRATHEQLHSNEALRGHAPYMNIQQNIVSFGTY